MTQDRIAAPSAAPIATGNRVCTEPSERAAAVPSRTRWLITWRTRPMAISRADCLAAVTPPAWHGGAPAGTSSQQKRGAESATAVFTILSPPGGQPFGLSHVQTAWRRTFSRSDAQHTASHEPPPRFSSRHLDQQVAGIQHSKMVRPPTWWTSYWSRKDRRTSKRVTYPEPDCLTFQSGRSWSRTPRRSEE